MCEVLHLWITLWSVYWGISLENPLMSVSLYFLLDWSDSLENIFWSLAWSVDTWPPEFWELWGPSVGMQWVLVFFTWLSTDSISKQESKKSVWTNLANPRKLIPKPEVGKDKKWLRIYKRTTKKLWILWHYVPLICCSEGKTGDWHTQQTEAAGFSGSLHTLAEDLSSGIGKIGG